MQPRDIFTFRFGDQDPSLDDLFSALPLEVCAEILGAKVSSEEEVKQALKRCPPSKRDELEVHVTMVLEAGRLDKADVEDLAKENGIPFTKHDSAYGILHHLIKKLGDGAEAVLAQRLRPTRVSRGGTFAEFSAPGYDVTLFKPLTFVSTLETALENALSTTDDPRLVKVRPQIVRNEIYVQVYFERPKVDGRRISKVAKEKRVTATMFEQGAGLTFFVVNATKARSRITFRSPTSTIAKEIKRALGQTMWAKPNAISEHPVVSYDLSVFKDPNLKLDVVEKYQDRIDGVLLSEIDVHAATGTLIGIKAPGRRGDALGDFHQLSQKAKVLIQNSDVKKVVLKFLPVADGRSLAAHVTIHPETLQLDDTEWKLVSSHLEAWGVTK